MLSTAPRIGIVFFLALALSSGCASSPHYSNGTLTSKSSQNDLADAWEMYNSNQFHQVIPQVLQIVERNPQLPVANEARYLLGLSYENIGGYKDAIDVFSSYIQNEPEGPYARESRDAIKRLTLTYETQFPSEESLERDIAALQKEIKTSPNSLPLQAQLADLTWKQGKYDDAGRLYFELAGKFPDFKANTVFMERIELVGNNSYTVLSPSEMQRRDIARNPLSIINTASFRTGRDRITRTAKHYVVTGQVLNRGTDTLYGVEVLTTVFGFGSTIFDTATYSIGLINPGETRAFSIRMSNFDDMNNISRFECKATYQK